VDEDILDIKLENYIYKKGHIQLATFFGGPLSIVYILAENFKQLGYPEKVKKTWIFGIGLFVLFIFLILMMQLSIKTPTYLPSLICILIGTAIMQSWQGDDIKKHVDKGGHVYSYWRAVLIGIVCLMITIVFLVMLALVTDKIFGLGILKQTS
jgi:hypothetical protein